MGVYSHIASSQKNPLRDILTDNSKSLWELSHTQKLYVVFVRHFGCTFCREVLKDLSNIQDQIQVKDMQLVIVHMSDEVYGRLMLERYKLHTAIQLSDPEQVLYKHFGLKQGNISQLFGTRIWIRGFYAGVLKGHGVGRLRGDGFQMPGYFILENGKVIEKYIPRDAADHPDYLALTECAVNP